MKTLEKNHTIGINEGYIPCTYCNLPMKSFMVYGQGSSIHIGNTLSQHFDLTRNKYTHEWKIVRKGQGCDLCPIYIHISQMINDLPLLWKALLPTISPIFNQIMNVITDFYFHKSKTFLQHIKIHNKKLFFRYHTDSSLLCHCNSYIYQPILLPCPKDPLWALPIFSIISRIILLFDMTYLEETIILAKQYSITHLPRMILQTKIQESTTISYDVIFIIIDYL